MPICELHTVMPQNFAACVGKGLFMDATATGLYNAQPLLEQIQLQAPAACGPAHPQLCPGQPGGFSGGRVCCSALSCACGVWFSPSPGDGSMRLGTLSSCGSGLRVLASSWGCTPPEAYFILICICEWHHLHRPGSVMRLPIFNTKKKTKQNPFNPRGSASPCTWPSRL